MESEPVYDNNTNTPVFLSGTEDMRRRIREFNWAETPLGAVDSWKQSLRSVLSICLNSNFPIAIYWGKELTLLYNDAWSPIPGKKHPWALGRPAKQVWPEIWDAIGPQFEKAFSGNSGGSKDALLPMQRHGYTEECYFDFTFTPVYGEDGKVDGIFNAVIETTFQIIHQRRAVFLHNLLRKISSSTSTENVFNKLVAFLKVHSVDIPFCFVYTISDEQKPMLAASTQPEIVPHGLPFKEILNNGFSTHIPELLPYLEEVPVIHWPEKPMEALLVPLKGEKGVITGYIFAGLSARRRFDEEYQIFIERMAASVSSTLNSIQSLEEERKRAEALDNARKKIEESEKHFRNLTGLLRNSEEKLEYLVKKRTEELERSNEDLQQFAHVASHDLKEPIRKIIVFSDLLREELKDSFNKKANLYLSKIQSASDRMLLMMEGVLRYAGLDGYAQGLEEIDLNKIIDSVETDLELVTQKINAHIEYDSLPVIQGYLVLIYQLFYNLISNALKFSTPARPSRIQIHYTKIIIDNRDFAQFIVKDNGIGFDPVNAEKIFHSFARLNPREEYEGTGLGLSLCKKIVSRHQGFIIADGELDIGAEFIIRLPFIQSI